jgi:ABC-type branched-subunit amino acid transport system substrate-binding protein
VATVLRKDLAAVCLAAACLVASFGFQADAQPASPGSDVDEISIGYFGPHDPADPDGGDMWRAASLAVEEANRRGGYLGKPFRLVPAWSENPWGTGVTEVTRLVYRDRVWAIIGGIDGPSTHLAEQVVAKSQLVLISPASTDKSVNLARVPWMFSCAPGDHLLAPVLVEAIERCVGGEPFVLLSTDGHDPHRFVVELNACFVGRRIAPQFHFECKRQADRAAEVADRAIRSKPAAVVLVADSADSARLVVALRNGGFDGKIFGSPAMGRSRFLAEAGEKADGVVFPLLYLPAATSDEFEQQFQNCHQRQPDYAAAHAHDAVRILVAAIQEAGLDRAGIREAVAQLSPFQGTTGTITWDTFGSNTRPAALGTIRGGRVAAFSK